MQETAIEYPNRIKVVIDKDTKSGDSLAKYPPKKGPWAVNPRGAYQGAGNSTSIAWIDMEGEMRSGVIAS